jgi:hypothetical protein
MVSAERRILQIEARLKDFLSRDLTKVERALVSFGVRGSRVMQGLVGATFNLKTALTGLATGYAALQAISLVRKFGEEADQMMDLAQSTGDMVENLSELGAAFKVHAGPGLDFESTLTSLVAAQNKAVSGSDRAREAFAGLGISIDELQAMAPSEMFERIAGGLDQYATAQEKALALSRLFPKQFMQLLPLLGTGLKQFQESIKEVRGLGATVTEAQANTSARLNDSLTKISVAASGVARALIEAFGPRTIAVLERVAKGIAENKEQVLAIAEAIGKGIVVAVNLAIDALIGLIGVIENIPFVDLIDEDDVRQKITVIKNHLRDLDEARTGSSTKRKNEILAILGDPEQFRQLGSKHVRRFKEELEALDVEIVSARSKKWIAHLAEREKEMLSELATLETTLQDGVAGALQKARERLGRELDLATKDIKKGATGGTAAVEKLGLPSLDTLQQYAAEAGRVIASVAKDAGSVFRKPTNKALPQPLEQQADPRARLAVLQQLGSLASDLGPVQDALADIERQSVILSLAEAKEQGTINAKELADAIAWVNLQFERTKQLVSGGSFFDGFSRGARKALRSWTDFTAAGEEAAATLVDGGLNGLTDAFADIITGTKSAKEAFKDFAKAMLADLARIIAKMIVMQTLQAIFGAEKGGVLPAMEKGGVIQAFASGGVNRNGGVARRPTVLFGEGKTAEAFVPLPDNRSIPVSFVGGGPSGGNNVNVNITAMDSRDVSRVLLEQQGTLRNIWTNQLETKHGMRQVVRRTAG